MFIFSVAGFVVMAGSIALAVAAVLSMAFRSAPDGAAVLAQLGLTARAELADAALRLEVRARRLRRLGALAGIVVGAQNAESFMGSGFLGPWAGYLLGLLVGELTLTVGRRGAVRSAALAPRESSKLAWRGWSGASVLTLLLAAAAALMVSLGRHPRGMDTFSDNRGSCQAIAYWPSTHQVIATVLVAVAALGSRELLRWRLVSRPAAAELVDPALEERRRLRVNRLADITGLAVALALLAGVAQAVSNGLHSSTCDWLRQTPPDLSHTVSNAYQGPLAELGRAVLQPVAVLLLVVSAVLMAWAPSGLSQLVQRRGR